MAGTRYRLHWARNPGSVRLPGVRRGGVIMNLVLGAILGMAIAEFLRPREPRDTPWRVLGTFRVMITGPAPHDGAAKGG